MIKFLIITFLILYLIFKFGGFLLRIFFNTLGNRVHQKFAEQATNGATYTKTKPKGSNVEVEFSSNNNGQKNKPEFKGGEYVDYEEVK
ncbi:hypothetical protein BH23BAC1_BH23BAC1_01160 [soil metagenome]